MTPGANSDALCRHSRQKPFARTKWNIAFFEWFSYSGRALHDEPVSQESDTFCVYPRCEAHMKIRFTDTGIPILRGLICLERIKFGMAHLTFGQISLLAQNCSMWKISGCNESVNIAVWRPWYLLLFFFSLLLNVFPLYYTWQNSGAGSGKIERGDIGYT